MQLLTAAQIKAWDAYTIENEPISSIALMERAAASFTDYFDSIYCKKGLPVVVVCGNGNNGGDGLAIARMLRNRFYDVQVLILRISDQDSLDFEVNLARLMQLNDVSVEFIHDAMPAFQPHSICIDALLGLGVSRPLLGNAARLVQTMNTTGFTQLISVDLPSGIPADSLLEGPAVKADCVYTFQVPKRSFFFEEHAAFCPYWVVGDIGLDKRYLKTGQSDEHLIEPGICNSFLRIRSPFSHKGEYGHVLLLAGGTGKMGAAILAGKAALRTGCGWVTLVVPELGMTAIHASAPEAMCISQETLLARGSQQKQPLIPDLRDTVLNRWGCGPGLGTGASSIALLQSVFQNAAEPMVLDADALNLLAANASLWENVPKNSILTPHPGEFTRLFGQTKNSMHRLEVLRKAAANHKVVIVLKGRFTRIALPDGSMWVNTTGNAGMASAGSGDVLTGMITSFLAQGLAPWQAAVTGVYLHGLAGDIALETQSEESLNASDIIACLGQAFYKMRRHGI
jgi:NAD(P)H-hydrate epimerase